MSSSTAAAPAPSSILRRRTIASSSSSTSFLLQRRLPHSFLRSQNPIKRLLLSPPLSDTRRRRCHHHHHLISWLSPPPADDFNGWAVAEAPPPLPEKKKGLSKVVVGSVGVSLVAVLAGTAYLSLSGRTPNLRLLGIRSLVRTKVDRIEGVEEDDGEENVAVEVSESTPESRPEAVEEKLELVKVSIPVDSTQLEAVSNLKKLKIMEDDARADELCTRREYARWLVGLNSSLERNPKHRIVPSISLSATSVAAFDDVSVEDPDFESIQALAEAGIIPSKLSGTNSFNVAKGDGSFCFHPERFISRQDLISWKAQLEYEPLPELAEQMSSAKVDYMDMKEMSSDASPELFIDMLAGEKSIIRKVFGQSRRLQPNTPSTKAQAAVALTSGRMAEAVYTEIFRLEAENASRQAATEEIGLELLERGDIKRFWDVKINEERVRGFEVEKLFIATLQDLEVDKVVQARTIADNLKEKAAMDCQRQLLQSLKEEVDEMSERLTSERATYVADQCSLREFLSDLQMMKEGLLDRRSVLEAEIEALRLIRSWVEDEARKCQARANVLEEVGRRWKWDNQS